MFGCRKAKFEIGDIVEIKNEIPWSGIKEGVITSIIKHRYTITIPSTWFRKVYDFIIEWTWCSVSVYQPWSFVVWEIKEYIALFEFDGAPEYYRLSRSELILIRKATIEELLTSKYETIRSAGLIKAQGKT